MQKPVRIERMTRKAREDRSSIADYTLTLRLTREDRTLLNELVRRRLKQARRDGMEITVASFVRALIRNEAEAQGIRIDSLVERPSVPAEEILRQPNGSNGSTLEEPTGE